MLKLSFINFDTVHFTVSQSKIDSLQASLSDASVDSVRIHILHQLFDEYLYESPSKAREIILKAINLSTQAGTSRLTVNGLNKYADFLNSQSSYDSAIIENNKALKLAEKIGFNKGKGEALLGLGNNYLRKGSLKKAEEYQKLNIEFSESIGDQDGVASSYNNMGNIYNELGEYAKAMESYTLSSQKHLALGNKKNAGITFANIGLIHQKLENYQEALNYYSKSDSIFKQVNFQPGRAFVLKNLAIVYEKKDDLDQALRYHNEALNSYKKMGRLREISQIQNTIGNLFWHKNDFNKALEHYLKSKSISSEIGDSIGMGMASQAIGAVYYKLGKLRQAEEYANQAITIATKIGIALTEMDAYETLSGVYSDQGDFTNAYQSQSRYIQLRDSLYTIEKRDLAHDIEAKYQNEQKAKEIALLASENDLQKLKIEKQESERNYVIAFAAITLLLIGLVYNQYRVKQKANTKLKELNRMKSDFFANISHEFRTPLSLIMAPLKEKMEVSVNQKEQEEYGMMYRNADHLFNLINQLLDLSKLENGKIKLEKSVLELSHFFKIIAASFSSLAEYRHIDFSSEIQDETIWVELDQDIIQKICYNLLSNAFKFTPEDGCVLLKVEFSQPHLKITISDTGSGIPIEDQDKVFNRFFQSSHTNQLGTGIGLALTKELVEFHQGKIRLSSTAGKGTTFFIEIPVDQISAPDKQETAVKFNTPFDFNTIQNKNNGHGKVGPLILIIEDNPDLRGYLGELFQGNYIIHKSHNGAEGIQKAMEIIPDLIICDVMMPEKDGMEVCEALKKAAETNHIPIILLTAKVNQESKLHGLTIGADDYLSKPFDPKELKIRVSNLLEQRRILKAKYAKLLLLQPDEIEVSSSDELFLKKVMGIVSRNMEDSEFTVDKFSLEVGMSRMQLHRKLSALTGYSSMTFVRHQRLHRATQLLIAGEPVSQVAYAVGFAGLSSFTRAFKKEFHVAPSEYKG